MTTEDDETAEVLDEPEKNVDLFPVLADRRAYQVAIRIIEGRQLAGLELHPFVTVDIGNQTRKTEVRKNTNSPFFDEYFVFEYNLPPAAFFDLMIKITCTSKKFFRNETIGFFKIDVATVYEESSHLYYHKWAVLLDPSDPQSQPKGYIKCDIFVSSVGERIKAPAAVEGDDDIDENLLLPEGLDQDRAAAKYQINIFYCEDLSDVSYTKNSDIKRKILRTENLLCPYIRVAFAGHVAHTSTKKHQCDPVYNSKIVICEWFPPLVHRIKFQVRDSSEKIMSTAYLQLDKISDSATDGFLPLFGPAYINLYGDMLENNEDGNLLNYGIGEGPAYRGRLFCQVIVKMVDDDPSVGIGFLRIRKKKKFRKQKETQVESLRRHEAIMKEQLPDIQSFMLTCVVQDVCMIPSDKFTTDDNFKIELSLGNDGRISKKFADGYCPKMPENADLEKYLSPLDDVPRPKTGDDIDDEEKADLAKYGDCFWNMTRSTAGPYNGVAQSDEYCRLPLDEQKPVLYIITRQQNDARRLYNTNLLYSLAHKLQDFLDAAQQSYFSKSPRDASKELRQYLAEITTTIHLSLTFIQKNVLLAEAEATVPKKTHKDDAGGAKLQPIPPVTQLDKMRSEWLNKRLEQCSDEMKEIRTQLNPTNVQTSLYKLRNFVTFFKSNAFDPQEPFPDIFVWLLVNGERVAYERYPVSKFIRSEINEELGSLYGKQITIYMKSPTNIASSDKEQPVAELTCNIWFGTMNDLDDYPHKDVPMLYLHGVISGYDDIIPKEIRKQFDEQQASERRRGGNDIFAPNKKDDDLTPTIKVLPPDNLTYTEHNLYEIRCHIYSARSLVGSDESGLSDPYAVMGFRGNTASTQIISQSVNPKWQETLAVTSITLYGNPVDIHEQGPAVTVQIFDDDVIVYNSYHKMDDIYEQIKGDDEYLGQFQMNCVVKLAKQPYEAPDFPPKLAWHNVDRYGLDSGEVLACAELFQLAGDMIYPPLPRITNGKDGVPIMMIPDTILPAQSTFTVECQFWGLREMKLPTLGLFNPRIEVEFSSEADASMENPSKLLSPIIKNYKSNPNFPEIKTDADTTSDQQLSPLGNGIITKTIELAADPLYRSPIVIRCINVQKFGRTSLIGTCTIRNIDQYVYKFEILSQSSNGDDDGTGSQSSLVSQGRLYKKSKSLLNIASKSLTSSMNSLKSIVSVKYKPPVIELSDDELMIDTDLMSQKDMMDDLNNSMLSLNSKNQGSKGTDSTSTSDSDYEGKSNGDGSDDGGGRGGGDTLGLNNLGGFGGASGAGKKSRIRERFKKKKGKEEEVDWWTKYSASVERNDRQIAAEKEKLDELKSLKSKKNNSKTQKMIEKYKSAKSKAKTKAAAGADKLSRMKKKMISGADGLETCKMYDQELENEKGFEGFQDHIKTFELIRGKINYETVGKFKGNLRLTEHREDDDGNELKRKTIPYSFDPFADYPEGSKLNRELIELYVRVFIVKAVNLLPSDASTGKADPYLKVSLGEETFNDRSNHLNGNLNPVFGHRFDFKEVKVPKYTVLTVQIWDYDRITADDLIGETKIDIEDRFFSRHRAAVGIPDRYDPTINYNQYRDVEKPSIILQNLCKKYNLAPPDYDNLRGIIKIRLPDSEGSHLLKTFYMTDRVKRDKEQEISKDHLNRNAKEGQQDDDTATDDATKMNSTTTVGTVPGITVTPASMAGSKVSAKNQPMNGSTNLIKSRQMLAAKSLHGTKSIIDFAPPAPATLAPPNGSMAKAKSVISQNAKTLVSKVLSTTSKTDSPANVGAKTDDVEAANPDDDENANYKVDDMALKVLQNFKNVPGVGCQLVPEHIESRPLFNPDKPGIEQGRVEMWVDIYRQELMGPYGPPCDLKIEPRAPLEYELRVIVYDTQDVIMDEHNALTGLSMSDIYVKGWVDTTDIQKTDVHYRSLNGTGNFNWRMIFKFFYLSDRERIVIKKRASLFALVETEVELPPRLNMQVWDADVISADDQLGTLELDLHKLPRGKKLPRLATFEGYKDSPKINLFKLGRIRGWWPFLMKDKHGVVTVSGKADLELEVLTAEEAETRKAGKGRDDPMALPPPNRPETSFAWFNNPVMLFKYVIWETMKWKCLAFMLVLLIIFFILIFIYGFPQYASAKLMGAA